MLSGNALDRADRLISYLVKRTMLGGRSVPDMEPAEFNRIVKGLDEHRRRRPDLADTVNELERQLVTTTVDSARIDTSGGAGA